MDDKTFELLEKLYNRFEDGFNTLNDRMDQMESSMATKQDIAGIEHTLGQKVDALMDGYQANTESIQALRENIQDLKKEVETHEIKLKVVK